MKRKTKLALFLFFLGFIGVLSTLTMEFPLPLKALEDWQQTYSETQIRALMLLNPTLFLLVGVILGVQLYKKVDLRLPVFEFLLLRKKKPTIYPLVIVALGGGLFAGLLITVSTIVFQPHMPMEFIELSEKFRPNPLVRYLYSGITEEIIVRFGLMTIIVWCGWKISKRRNPWIYWIGIIFSSLLFAVIHLPLIFGVLESPGYSVIAYVLLYHILGGSVFGWLYWKKGLETAILAHIITHIVLLFAGL